MPEPTTLSHRFTRTVDGLNDRLGALLRWLALVMVLIGAFNALARHVTKFTSFSLYSPALFELQWYLFSVIFLLGAAYGLRHDVHVRVDVAYARLSEKGRALIDVIGGLLFLLPFSALMLWVSYPAVRNSWVIREVSPDPAGLPRYPIKALILVSFALLLIQGLAQIVRGVAIMRGKEWALAEGDAKDEVAGGVVSDAIRHSGHAGEGPDDTPDDGRGDT